MGCSREGGRRKGRKEDLEIRICDIRSTRSIRSINCLLLTSQRFLGESDLQSLRSRARERERARELNAYHLPWTCERPGSHFPGTRCRCNKLDNRVDIRFQRHYEDLQTLHATSTVIDRKMERLFLCDGYANHTSLYLVLLCLCFFSRYWSLSLQNTNALSIFSSLSQSWGWVRVKLLVDSHLPNISITDSRNEES